MSDRINEIDMWAYYKRHAAREAPPTDDDLAGLPAEREITEVYNNRAEAALESGEAQDWDAYAGAPAPPTAEEQAWAAQDEHIRKTFGSRRRI